MNIEIVPITESHTESFHACIDSVARENKYLGKFAALPFERFGVWVKETIANDVSQFIALDNSTVVGWCDVFPAWSNATRHRGTLGMGVLVDYRGRGIGKKLLSACLIKAQATGLTRIELEARADNTAAIKLYEKFGFVHEALKRQALRYDGVYYDSVQMSLVCESDGSPNSAQLS